MNNPIHFYKRRIVNLKTGLSFPIDFVSVCISCFDHYQERYTNQKQETYLKFHRKGKGKMFCAYCERITTE